MEAGRAHRALDRAVASAYSWPEEITTDDALQRLLALNLARGGAGERNPFPPRGGRRHRVSDDG
jgi:hypothetical protein